jgi:predicted phage terminase large subunit-like protein
MRRVVETCKKFKIDHLLIENASAGKPLEQEIRRQFSYESFMTQLVNPHNQSKEARLYSIQGVFVGGQIYAPDREWAETVITQVGAFPRAKHDDLTDTVSMAIRHLRDIGLLTRSAERLQEIEESKIWRGGAPKQLYPV